MLANLINLDIIGFSRDRLLLTPLPLPLSGNLTCFSFKLDTRSTSQTIYLNHCSGRAKYNQGKCAASVPRAGGGVIHHDISQSNQPYYLPANCCVRTPSSASALIILPLIDK